MSEERRTVAKTHTPPPRTPSPPCTKSSLYLSWHLFL